MKVLAINPGHVFIYGDSWVYTIFYETDKEKRDIRSKEGFLTAAGAKQAMREKVAQERKKHCV